MEFPEMDEDFESEGTSTDEELEEPKTTLEPGFFRYRSDNATDIFRQYFKAIKKNRYLLKLIDDVLQLDNSEPCYLSTTASVTDTRGNYKDHPLPKLSGDQQEDNPSASKKIELTKIENKDRGFKAVSEIKAGENVIVEKAIVFMILPNCKCMNYAHFSCHHCAAPVFKFVTCEHCDVCVFCDEKCYSEAWESYHQFECYAMQRHFLKDVYVAMGFRMMLACLNKKNTETTSDSTKKFEILHSLETHMSKHTVEQWNVLLHEAARVLVYLIEKTDFFKKMLLIRDKKQCKPYYMYMYTGGLLLRFMCAARVGIIQIPILDVLGLIGCYYNDYPAFVASKNATMLNHSCAPNCIVVHNKDHVIVRAAADIKLNEELTICYFPVKSCMNYLSRVSYTRLLFFECMCDLCLSRNLEVMYNTLICRVCKGGVSIYTEPPHCFGCKRSADRSSYLQLLEDAESLYNEFLITDDIKCLYRYLTAVENVFSSSHNELYIIYQKIYMSFLGHENKFKEGCYIAIKSFNICSKHVSDCDLYYAYMRYMTVVNILIHKNFPEINWQPDDVTLLEELLQAIEGAAKVLVIYYETDEVQFLKRYIKILYDLIYKLRVKDKQS